MASLEVDTSSIEVGQCLTVKWRGKPVFIRRRSDTEIEKANDVILSGLRDPQTDLERAPNPEVGQADKAHMSFSAMCLVYFPQKEQIRL